MTKFNVLQKKRRAQIAEHKRRVHGDPNTAKLKNKPQPLSISGKRKRKLFKKWRREQKEALQNGVITMEDVKMAVAEDNAQDNAAKAPTKIRIKKSSRLKVRQLKRAEKKNPKQSTGQAAKAGVDAMVE
ncbi:hypothetical protein Syun_018086 [Stephania yunnanensis]|uniref:Uncharacterized protein n=1 Tax=Stephania yunnanensis TaxID=152371 RepID=A0AAP0IRR2_9MAGN